MGMIDKAIADSALLYNMQTQNQHLFKLIEEGKITKEEALKISRNPNDLRIIFQTKTMVHKEDETKPTKENNGGILGKRPSPFSDKKSPGQK